MQHAEDGIVFTEDAANGSGGVDAEWLEFAQQKQSEDMVKIGIGKHRAYDWRLARDFARMQFGRGFDLRAEVR
jgi:hypothetical protein